MPDLTIQRIQAGLRSKEFSARELTQNYLQTIAQKDGDIQAFLAVYSNQALETATRVDEIIASDGILEPLAGVPIAIKDNILIENQKATAGSKMLENYTALYDAGVIRKLKKHNAIFLGKTNLDEFAMGSSTENSAYQITKNPHDLTRVPGGSSGGSTAAVAAQMAPAALGSDTGGSIRQPAHFCGVVGLKPTYGSVSRSGLIAMASSLDQIGPITQTVADAAIVFDAISGNDPYDNTSTQEKNQNTFANLDTQKAKGMTVGLPKEYFESGSDPEVNKALEEVIQYYQSQGVVFKEISLPHTKYGLACYYIIQPAQVSSNLARFDTIRYSPVYGIDSQQHDLEKLYIHSRSLGFGQETQRRIMLGTFVLSSGYYDAYYKKAEEAREYIRDDFQKAFGEVDTILTPVAPTPAFKIGEKTQDPLSMYLSDIFSVPASLAGLPAISIPTRKQPDSLPIGFQIIGQHFHESDILNLGHLYEQV